ncbi:MAG: nucleoside triphosphate pyrophosphatase [Desulfovibrionaceae bacterium]
MYRSALPLVLASASPRRLELLGSLGIDFTVRPSRAPEPAPAPGEGPDAYAMRLAGLKAAAVAEKLPARLDRAAVLAADTIVVLGNRVLGKPRDADDALEMLRLLRGQTHEVITGCCLLAPGREPAHFAGRTRVRMRAATDAELIAYVATGEPMDKAGAYAIQGLAACLISHVEGSYTNVVGLPLAKVLEVLLECGVVIPKE